MGRPGQYLLSVEYDPASAPIHQAHNGPQRRGFTGAVTADQANDLTPAYDEVDALKNMARPIPGL